MAAEVAGGTGNRGAHILYGMSVTCIQYLLLFVDDYDEIGFKRLYSSYQVYGYLGAFGTNGAPGNNRTGGDLLWLLLN